MASDAEAAATPGVPNLSVARGAEALYELLADRLVDVRELDLPRFREWLELHLRIWESDPVFQQRERIRELRHANPSLEALESIRDAARAAYESSPFYSHLESLGAELQGAERAIAGLGRAVGEAGDASRRRRQERKLQGFVARAERLREDLRLLTDQSPERQAFEEASARLLQAREETGFTSAVEWLQELHRRHGRGSGRSGSRFESAAIRAIGEAILPILAAAGRDGGVTILRGVTLGAARTELDQVLVRLGERSNDPVEVLAVVEAKRNPNDLAHGLRRRLENLSFLADAGGGFDPEAYRNIHFPGGRFDSAAVHVEEGKRYLFTASSFARFLGPLEQGGIPDGLFFVTRSAPLWGISSGGLARLAHRVATDVDWDLASETYLETLLAWVKELTHEMEAPEVLRRFASTPEISGNVLLIEDP